MPCTTRTLHALVLAASRRLASSLTFPLAAVSAYLAARLDVAPFAANAVPVLSGAQAGVALLLLVTAGAGSSFILKQQLDLAVGLREALDGHASAGDADFAHAALSANASLRRVLWLVCASVVVGLAFLSVRLHLPAGPTVVWASACLAVPLILLAPVWKGLVRAGGFPILADRPLPLPARPFSLVERLAHALDARARARDATTPTSLE